MARTNNLSNFLTDVSNAIKQKTGDNTPIPASNFDTEILSIETGGNYQSKTLNVTQNGNYNLLPDQEFDAISNVNISVSVSPVLQNKTITENGSYTADQNYDGLGTVIVNVQGGTINNQDKTITQNGTYTADSGYTGLGTVTVNVSSGSGDVKLFETEQAMQADPSPSEGDLAVVYRSEIQPIQEDSEFSSCTFPNEVVLDEAFSDSIYGSFRSTGSGYFDGTVDMSASRFRFNGYGDKRIRVQYTSQDGITYTRTDGGEELQEFGTTIKYEPTEPWNDIIGNFMKIGGNYFEGLYEYKHYIDTNLAKLPLLSSCIVNGSSVNFGGEFCDTSIDLTNLSNLIRNWSNDFTIPTYINFVCSDNKWYILVPYKDDECLSEILYTAFNTDGTYSGVAGLTCNKLKRFEVRADEIAFIDDITPTHTVLRNTTAINAFLINDIITISNNYNTTSYKFNGACNYIVSGNYNGNFGFNVTDASFVDNYVFAQTQLNATPDYVYETTFYGKNGVESGTLTTNISSTFDDKNAEVYSKIMQAYDNMSPMILTDDNKEISKSIKLIPVKSNGEPLLDTSNVTNMSYMFGGCTSLTTVPLLNTQNVTDMSSMFWNCPALTTVPLFNTQNVTNMGGMFAGCPALTTVPLLNTQTVTNMSSMFSNCPALTTVPSFNTQNVTNMSTMFSGCTSLTTVPLLNTQNVTNMYGMFLGCPALTTVPLLNTQTVTNMSDMFSGCPALTTVPSFNTQNVTSMRTMFSGCTSLTTVPLLNTQNVTSMYDMFSGCQELTNESLNNILAMCTNATKMSSNKTLKKIGLTQAQAQICTTLSNYQAFVNAGWTTGY